MAAMNVSMVQGTAGLTSADTTLHLNDPEDSGFVTESSLMTSTSKQQKRDVRRLRPIVVKAESCDQSLTLATVGEGARGGGAYGDKPLLDLRAAEYPMYVNPKTRLSTLNSCYPEHSQKPAELANLGFFYMDNSDCLCCFYCGLGLVLECPTSNAAYLQARYRPQCLYNCFLKGQDFIDRVQQESLSDTRGQSTAQSENACSHLVTAVNDNAIAINSAAGASALPSSEVDLNPEIASRENTTV